MPTATMTSKGQITVPKEVRDELGLDAGVKIWFVRDHRGGYRIIPRNGKLSDLAGILYDPNRKPVSIEEMNEAIAEGAAEGGMDGYPIGVPRRRQ